MPLQRLELASSYGDQTLSRVRFVVHGTSNATDAETIRQLGFRFAIGSPVVSSNIVHAHDWTRKNALAEPGKVFVLAIPQEFHVGYGAFTSAYIDRQLKRVSGAPLRYAAARKQLAFYTTSDTDAERMHVESEVANGYPIEQHHQFQLESKYVIGSFSPGQAFDELINKLNVSVGSMEVLDYDRLESSFYEVMQLNNPNNSVMAQTAIRDILVATVESMVISTLRTMHWQGLQLLGFKFFEGQQEVKISAVASIEEHRRRMDELGRLLASSSLFASELAWLKVYVAHELELMRVELDGAEHEALPD